MSLRRVSKGSYGSNLLQMDVGSADRLAQHDLHITERVLIHAWFPATSLTATTRWTEQTTYKLPKLLSTQSCCVWDFLYCPYPH
eukprot:1143747-Pelagomonas_calceolata.AAC.2